MTELQAPVVQPITAIMSVVLLFCNSPCIFFVWLGSDFIYIYILCFMPFLVPVEGKIPLVAFLLSHCEIFRSQIS